MHGLGDTEAGWAGMLEDDFAVAPGVGPCSMVLPRAPMQAVGCNGGGRCTSWFDMAELPIGAEDDPPRHGCSVEEALASTARVHRALDSLVERGVPPERIMTGGFSQGAAMALLAALTYPKRLGGVIMFSGVVFFGDRLSELVQPEQRGIRVFWGHGTRDNILRCSLHGEGAAQLEAAGFEVQVETYPCMHSSTPKEICDASAFFNDVLGGGGAS